MLKDHWSKQNKFVTEFAGCHSVQRSVYPSGYDDKMFMDMVRADYKNKYKKKFTLEYWWDMVKEMPKWKNTYLLEKDEARKRGKTSETGAYISSSSKDAEESVDRPLERRPPGQKGTKRKGKAAAKADSSSSNLPDPTMQLYHDAIARKSAATEMAAEARKEKASAMKDYAAATLEKARTKKLSKYMKLLETDTSGYDAAKLQRYNQLLNLLSMELSINN